MHKLNLPIHGDALVRFLYCRLPGINFALNRLLFWHLYASRISQLDARFEEARQMLTRSHFDFRGKTVLELGPGNSRLNAYNFLMNGVRKVILVDKFPRYHVSRRQKEFADTELGCIKKKYAKTSLPFQDSAGRLKADRLQFISGDITSLDLPPVDFIYSISVLEHIKTPATFIKKCADFLKPGGLMFHHIDLRDHYNFDHPFLFYKYSPKVWNQFLTKEGHSYTNRWRYDDFLKTFRRYRLKLLIETKQAYPLDLKKIHRSFQHYHNLNIGIWNCLLKK